MSQTVKKILVTGLCCEISFIFGCGLSFLQLRKSKEYRRTLYNYCPRLLEGYYSIENFARGSLYGSKLKHSDLNSWVCNTNTNDFDQIPVSD